MNKAVLTLVFIGLAIAAVFSVADAVVTINPENPDTNDIVSCFVNGAVRPRVAYLWFVNEDILEDIKRNPIQNNPLNLEPLGLELGDRLGCEAWLINPNGRDHRFGSDEVVLVAGPVDRTFFPDVTITQPSDGDTLDVNQEIFFDSETGDLDDDEHTYLWNFGDGQTGVQEDTFHTYNRVGQFTVTVTVTDNEGHSGSDSIILNIQDQRQIPPEAEFDYNGNEFCTTDIITFDASRTRDNMDELELMNFAWDFDDGQRQAGQGLINIRHQYAQPGEYTVTLTVTDVDGNENTTWRTVLVNQCPSPEDNIAPRAEIDLVANGGDICTLVPVRFDASRTVDNQDNIDQLLFSWDFDDGENQEGIGLIQVEHSFENPREYIIVLTVTDSDGNINREIIGVIVEDCQAKEGPKPQLDVNFRGDRICAAETTVILNGAETTDNRNEILDMRFKWDLGDGSPVIEEQGLAVVLHNYLLPGVYTVTMTVTDTDGNVVEITRDVVVEDCEVVVPPVVNEPPVIDLDLGFDPANVCVGDVLTADASGTVDDNIPKERLWFAWDFDGNGAPEQSGWGFDRAQHVYNIAGEYTLRLNVYDDEEMEIRPRHGSHEFLLIIVRDCRVEPPQPEPRQPIPARHTGFDVMSVRSVNYKQAYLPGETVTLVVSVRNSGNIDQSLWATTSAYTLGLFQRERGFDLNGGETITRIVSFNIPYNAQKGWHAVTFNVFNNQGVVTNGNWAFYAL